jgi:hypothetical protein
VSTDLTALVVLLVLVALAVLAPRRGVDSRRSREWSQEGPLDYPGADHPGAER